MERDEKMIHQEFDLKQELAQQAGSQKSVKDEVKLTKNMTIPDMVKVMMPEIKKALPTVLTPERFTRIALSALNNTPALQKCTPSLIYANICVVGKKENIRIIVDAVQELQYAMQEIVRDLKTGDFPLSEEAYLTLKEDMLALAITVVDILNGAAYLFDQKSTVNNKHWKSDLELEDFRNSLGLATKSKSNC